MTDDDRDFSFFSENAPEITEDFVRRMGAPVPVALLCKKLIAHMQQGNVCMILADDERAALKTAPGVSEAPDDSGIFILDGGRLYTRRYYAYEKCVRNKIREMSRTDTADTSPLPDASGSDLSELQREAVGKMLSRRFSILTGGPGTGKTFTIARAVKLARQKDPDLRIALAAPTGKAAARIKETMLSLMQSLGIAGIPDATTLHSLLGPNYDGVTFRCNRENPLPCDWVIVDEASMIDLPLMAKLLDALPDACRLTLVGDEHQLASVEKGRVFGDLCRIGEVAKCELTQSRRFAEGSAIGRLSSAINAGRPDETLAILRERSDSVYAVFLEEGFRGYSRWENFTRTLKTAFGNWARQTTAEGALRHLNDFRILCAMRRGVFGAEGLNRYVRALLGDSAPTPVLITQNDPALDLHNGDTGVVMPGSDEFCIPDGDGKIRRIPLALVPHREIAFAGTIHKAQGSEFDDIAIVLPDSAHPGNGTENPLLTREILYTAITRARKRVFLYAGENAIRHCCECVIRRDTGLGG
ncbi:MAG: exodeoxyribonuclease V subunit alpha [Victivallaceae bacterium]|nr:exodeoxyribonuclease V subunit alpha [Victivallaceae bacterium]